MNLNENKEWMKQIPRLFILSLIYDIAFIDPFTAIKKLNPILGLLGIFIASIIFLVSKLIKLQFLETISIIVLLISFTFTLIASIRRKPVYIFEIKKSEEIVKKKGFELKKINDLEHAKAIIEYALYMSQKSETPTKMKYYLDIAYTTWFKVIKQQRNNLYLGIFKKK